MHVISDLPVPLADAKNVQMNVCMFVVMFAMQPRVGADDLDPEFFVELAHQRGMGGFAGFNLAAGEFPVACIDRVGSALAEEKAAIGTLNNGGGNVNGFWSFQIKGLFFNGA